MLKQDEGSLIGAWPALASLIVVVVGLIASHQALVSPRPPTDGSDNISGAQGESVPARLWQDPLGTVLRDARPSNGIKTLIQARPQGCDCDKKVLFLLNLISADGDLDAAEARRRERYDIFSALNTAGYVPTEPNRLRYMHWSACSVATGITNGEPDAGRQKGVPIPYEWVKPCHDAKLNQHYQSVCVLWVSPSTDGTPQFSYLKKLANALQMELTNGKSHKDHPVCEVAVNGQISSEQLDALLQEECPPIGPAMTLYVTCATANKVRDNSVKVRGLKVEYIIDTDSRLGEKLQEELGYRGIYLGSTATPVAIVAEWDTEYGRYMHKWLFGEETSKKLKQYSYLRGLDGKTQERAGKSKAGAAAEPDSAANNGLKPASDKPTAKLGVGQQQFDYLLRLAERMKLEQRELGGRFHAIGILGNDVYDKILLLQALRPHFPDAVFFTTDLDARLIQPGDYATTRNLLIASHYGLSLNADLQAQSPPFRSSYDTASYLGCLRAVQYSELQPLVKLLSPDEQKRLFGKPSNGSLLVPKDKTGMPIYLYEVGRHGAYELSLREKDDIGPKNPRNEPWVTLHHRPWLLAGMFLAIGIFLMCVSRPWREFILWPWRKYVAARRKRFQWAEEPAAKPDDAEEDDENFPHIPVKVWVGVVLFLLALGLIMLHAHTTEHEEPFEWFEGLSVWPTVLFRLLAVGLCLYYLHDILRSIDKRNHDVWKAFPCLDPQHAHSLTPRTAEEAKTVSELYLHFLQRGSRGRRLWRTAGFAALTLGLFLLFWLAFEPSVMQARGLIARCAYFLVLGATLGASATLFMFVVDATLLSYRLVVALARMTSRQWPEDQLEHEAKRRGLQRSDKTDEAVGKWLSVSLIKSFTFLIAGQLIYCPFVVLLVLVVAQNRIFDNWNLNPVLFLTVLVYAVAIVSCALMLQQAAQRVRKRALDALDEILEDRSDPVVNTGREKLERIRSDIDGVKNGAFAGLYDNPLVRAVLVPLVGGGGLAALEALLTLLARRS